MPSIKKIFATITLVVTAFGMASPAAALTADELQAQINSLLTTIASLQAQLASTSGSTGTVAGCTITSFATNLSVGSKGADVKCLQIILNSNSATQIATTGAGSPGNESTYFGPMTKAAVIKYQNLYKSEVLTPVGLTAGTGFVGAATRTKLNTQITTTTGGGTTTPVGGANTIALASSNPAVATVAKGAQNVVFMTANVCAAAQANTISKVIVTRSGIAADTDIANVKIYNGLTQLGATQALNSTTHKATFSGLNWTIPANTCKVLTVKASIASGAAQGDAPKFEITAASDVTSTVALTGTYPLQSNAMNIASISTGAVYVTALATPSGIVLAGATEQALASFRFAATSTEAINVTGITVTKGGSAIDSDITNIKLFVGSTQLGSTVASLTNGKATIDFSSTPVTILASASKTLTVYADIGTSVGVATRNVNFEITANTDVTAYGSNSGGQLVAYGTTATDTWAQTGATIEIDLGSLSVTQDASYSPSAQDYARGTTQDGIVAFKFTAGSDEAVRITYIKLTRASASLADTDVNNISLYDAVTGELIAGPATQQSGAVTFGYNGQGLDSTGLFDIAKSQSKTILVKADVSSSASATNADLGYKLAATGDVKADGLSSMNDLSNATLSSVGATLKHNIIAEGTLTVGPSSNTPAAATYALGVSNYTLAKFDLTSTGEDMVVSQFNVYIDDDNSSTATATAASAGDVTNLKLYDGTTLLATDNAISSGVANFSINLTVAKNTTKTLTLVGDIPTGSTAGYLQAWVNAADDVTASGKDSGATITVAATAWASVKGNLMTSGAPGLTITAATVPAAKTFIKNSTGDLVTTLYFTANTSEDLRITRIKIGGAASDAATVGALFTQTATTGTGYDVKAMVSNVKLYNGSTQLGSTIPTMIDGTNYDYADFTGLSLTIPKGTTKAIDVKLDVIDTSAYYYYFGVATNTDVTGAGYTSGTALATSTIAVGANGEIGKAMSFGSAGTLTVAADPDAAISATYVAGDTKVTMGSWKFTAAKEAINLSKLVFDVNHSSVATGTSVGYAGTLTSKLYALATSTDAHHYSFDYSIDDGAQTTCSIWWGEGIDATTTTTLINVLNSASSTCNAVIRAATSLTADGALSLYATPTGYSLEILDNAAAASNVADDLKIGLKYGGTETVARYAGASQSIGAVYLYDGSTLLGTSYPVSNIVTFNLPTGSEVSIPVGNKVLTLKVDLSAYTSLVEGSTLKFTLGNSTDASDTDYITAKGASSGSTVAYGSINSSNAIGSLATNEMWLYATKPVLSLDAVSPSGAKVPNSNQEVFRFDVNNSHPSISLDINALRFTISNTATSSLWGKTFNLYKSTDLTTSLGSGVATANTTSDTTGWVAIYPTSGYTVGANSTVAYVLKADTSGMNVTTGNDLLSVSLESGDFFWDDGVVVNANQKVSGLPVQGNTLTY